MLKTKEFYREYGHEDVGYMPAPLSSKEEYPLYIEKAVCDAVGRIQKVQNEHTVSFAFMTDIHYALNENHTVRFQRTMRAYREIAKRTGVDFLILGGDYTNEGCKEYKMQTFRELRALLGGNGYFPVNGNHDDGSIWDQSYIQAERSENHLTHTELYTLFYNHLPKSRVEFDAENHSLYYLYNDLSSKTRYIFMDTGDVPYLYGTDGKLKYGGQHLFAMSQRQIDWLTGTALRFDEEGWSVIFVSHALLLPEEEEHPAPISENLEIVRRIVTAYQNGEKCRFEFGKGDFFRTIRGDFDEYCRAKVIGMFCGHEHFDEVAYYGSVPIVVTQNAVMYDKKGGKNTKRTDGTASELLFDIVTVDKQAGTITTVRIGAGEDRVIRY